MLIEHTRMIPYMIAQKAGFAQVARESENGPLFIIKNNLPAFVIMTCKDFLDFNVNFDLTVTSQFAGQGFSRLTATVAQSGIVCITKVNVPQYVMLGFKRYLLLCEEKGGKENEEE